MTARGLPAFGRSQPPADPRGLAREIIARGGFHLQARTEQISWWNRFLDWLGSLVKRFLPHVAGPSSDVFTVLGTLLVLAAAGLVLYAVIRLLSNISADGAPSGLRARALPSRTASKVWYERALAAAGNGRFREAAVLLFRAALTILDFRGYVHDEPSRTVEECASELRERAPEHMRAFRVLARTFSAAVYAERAIDMQEWERARSAYEQLVSSVTGAA